MKNKEEKDEIEEMDRAADESEGKTKFGPEKHGIPKSEWPKKFIVDGGLKYEFGGEAPKGDEGAPGKTHEYDKIGKITEWPKKFVTDGNEDDFE